MFAASLEFAGVYCSNRPAEPCGFYPALLGCWFPGPNFQANSLAVLAAICDKMQLGSLRWIIQLRLPERRLVADSLRKSRRDFGS